MSLLRLCRPDSQSSDRERQWYSNYLNLHLAHDAVMLDDADKSLAQSRATTAAHARRTAGDDVELPAEDENSMVHIGNQTTNHIQPPAVMGTIAKLALAAGMAAIGAGLPAAAWLAKDFLRPAAAPAAPAAPSIDTNSVFDFDIVNPDPQEGGK
jgi:hypothetical protein